VSPGPKFLNCFLIQSFSSEVRGATTPVLPGWTLISVKTSSSLSSLEIPASSAFQSRSISLIVSIAHLF